MNNSLIFVFASPRGNEAITDGRTLVAFSLDPKIDTRLLKNVLASILLAIAELIASSIFLAATIYLDASPEDCSAIAIKAVCDKYFDEYFALATIAPAGNVDGFLDTPPKIFKGAVFDAEVDGEDFETPGDAVLVGLLEIADGDDFA